MEFTRLRSPAKINLYLNILSKLKSGYHNIETVFERVSLWDEILLRKLKKSAIIKIECNHPDIPTDRKNLAYRAAEEFLKFTNKKTGLHIRISKKIPISSGLGGGSSNAASVLLGLNRLFGTGLDTQKLIKIGRAIGSDVPFFILNKTNAFGSHHGEVLTPLEVKKVRHYVLASPNLRISTRQTYNAWGKKGDKPRLGLTRKKGNVKIWIHLLKKDVTTLSKHLYNSLERVVLDKYPILKYTKRLLLTLGAGGCLVSGSGSVVFGLCYSRKEAMLIKKRILLKHPDWQVEAVRSY